MLRSVGSNPEENSVIIWSNLIINLNVLIGNNSPGVLRLDSITFIFFNLINLNNATTFKNIKIVLWTYVPN